MGSKSLFLVVLLAGVGFADTGFRDMIRVTDTDNSPSCMAGQMVFGDGQLSCSGNVATVTITGGGGGGSSSLEVMRDGVRVTSPTASLNLKAGTNVTLSGSLTGAATAAITINATSTVLPSSAIAFGSFTSTASANTEKFIFNNNAQDWPGGVYALHIGSNPFKDPAYFDYSNSLNVWGPQASLRVIAESGLNYPLYSVIGDPTNLSSAHLFSVSHDDLNRVTFQATEFITNGEYNFIGNGAQSQYMMLQSTMTTIPVALTVSSNTTIGTGSTIYRDGLASFSKVRATGLTSENCIGTDSTGLLQPGTCGSGGGGSSALEILANGLRVSSPTAGVNFAAGVGTTVSGSLTSSTATIKVSLDPNATNFIQATSTLQTGATFYVSSGTVAGQLTIAGAGAGEIDLTEGVAPSGIAGSDVLYADSTDHTLKAKYNNGTAGNVLISTTTGSAGQCAYYSATGQIVYAPCRATPGGSNGQLQYNNNGDLGGLAYLTYSPGQIVVSTSMYQTGMSSFYLSSGVYLTAEDSATFKSTIAVSSNSYLGTGTTVYTDGTIAATRIRWSDGTIQVSSPTAGGGSGDITDVIAGSGLTGGAASGAATLNVGTTVAFLVNSQTWSAQQTFTSTITVPSTQPFTQSSMGVSWDGGGSALTAGTTYWVQVPSSGTITGFTFTANPAGTATVNISSSAAFGISNAGRICASACPALSAASVQIDNTLTGWSTAVAKEGWLYFVINSAATMTQANLSVRYRKE